MRFSDFLLVSDPTDLDFIVGYTDEQNIRINVLDLFAGQIIGGGTPGYVPVFTAENVIDDSVIFQHGTNIVIGGVDSLGYKLAVSGSLYASNGAVINSTALGADALRVIAVDGDIFVIPNDSGQSISSLRRIAHPPAVLATESATLGQLNTAISNLEGDIEILLDLKVDKSSVGEPNGVASLDATGKIPLSEIPDSIIGQVEYMGTWNAFTNTPTLNPLIPEQKGHYYVVSAAGVFGGVDYQVGDWIISNGVEWQKVDNTDAVTSVFGRIGAILALEADYQSFYPRLSQAYDNPTWINTLAFSKITGVPPFLLENQTITLSGDVTGSGKTSIASTISNNAVTDSKLRDSVGTSVIGRASSTTGDPADIQASTDGHVLQRSGGTLLFGLISSDSIGSIDWSKIINTPTTLSGYGITNAYTKTESDNKFVPYTGANANVNLGSNNITANAFVKAGGTSAQFLKADGSVDVSQYVPTTRSVNAGTGLTGGGNLSSDVTLAFDTTWGDTRYAYRTRQLTINGTTYDLSADRIWNVGTVTSVGLSMPSAFTVSNSPIIGSGTLTVVGAGTTSEYVRGDGSLALFPSLTGYVPYNGATQNVNLGEYGLTTGFLGFDLTPTNTPSTPGTMFWSADDETVDIIMDAAVTQKIGQETFYLVKNQTGASIPKGTVVRADGTVGASGRILIAPFLANGTFPSKFCIGVTSETIANGADGFVTAFGKIRQINTASYPEGTVLYASPTSAGGYTSTIPQAPNNIVTVAIVIYSNANNGSIFVRPTFGSSINEDEGVKITSPLLNQGLFYNGGYWVNKTIASALGYTPVNQATTLTINGQTFDLSANRTWSVGTVTSVGLSVPTGFSIGSSPVTTSGTLALTFASGYSLPTNASQSNWDTAYTNRITSLTTTGTSGAATLVSNVLNIPIYQAQGNYITSLTGEATGSGPGAASITLVNSAVTGKVLTGLTVTGSSISATDSILTAFGKLQGQVNDLIGGLQYQGTWNASTNTPTITSGVGTDGHFYIVSVAGNTTIDGVSGWQVGDWIVFHTPSWQKVDNTESVVSVNGLTGAVTLTTSNISEGTNLYFTNARARTAISLTNTGNSGASTYNNGTGVLNVPQYTLAGLGGVPTTRSLTINGTAFDLSADRSWSVGTVTSVATSGPITGGTITGTGTIGITQSSSTTNGFLSSTDWNTFNNKQATISLTTNNNSGVSTFIGNVLNVPNYTLSGLGGVPTSRTLTINGVGLDLSTDRSWSVGTVTGTGAAGQVAYWSSGSAITGESNLFWDASNDRLGVNISNPLYSLDVRNSTNSEPYVQAQFKSDGGANIGGTLVAGTTQAHVRFLVNSGTWGGVGARQWQIRVGNGASQDRMGIYSWTNGNDVINFFSSGNVSIGNESNAYKLDVTGTGNFNSDGVPLTLQGGGRALFFNVKGSPTAGNTGVTLRTDAGSYLSLATGTNPTRVGVVVDFNNNLGIQELPNASWGTSTKALQINDSGALYDDGFSNTILANNSYYNGSGNIKLKSGFSSRIIQEISTGNIYFQVAGTGAGGTAPSYDTAVLIEQNRDTTFNGDVRITSNEPEIYLNKTGIDAGTWRIMGSTGETTRVFRIYDQNVGTDRFDIFSNGNVSVGNIVDNGIKFQVTGGGVFSQGLSITGHGGLTNSASKINIDFFGGNSRYYSLGANTSTRGGFEFHTNSSDGSIDVIALGIAPSGAATFSSSVTTGGAVNLESNESYVNLFSSYAVGLNARARFRAVGAGGGSGYGGDFRLDTRATNNVWNTDVFVVNYSGNVGIGTAGPGAKLQVNNGTNLNVGFNTTTINSVTTSRISSFNDAVSATVGLAINGTPLVFQTEATVRAQFTSLGNLIINPTGTYNESLLTVKGATTDGKQIHIVQSNDDRGWRFSARTDGHFYLAATHNGSDSNILSARYDTGNVLIGNATAADNGARLQVSGLVAINSDGGGSALRLIGRAAADASAIRFFANNNSTQNARIESNSSEFEINSISNLPITFKTNDTTRLTIAASTGAATFSSSVTATGNYATIAANTSTAPQYYLTQTGGNTYSAIGINRADGTGIAGGIGSALVIRSGDATDFPIQFATANNVRLTIATSGNVGIGTPTPSGQLHLRGASGLPNFGDQMLQIESTTSNFSGIVFSGTNGSNAAIRSEGASTMTFWTASGTSYTERMRIFSGGNVHIGPTPAADNGARLQVSGTATFSSSVTAGTFSATDATGSAILTTNGGGEGVLSVNTANPLRFFTNGSEKMRITSGGNVGIGTPGPVARLDTISAETGTYGTSTQQVVARFYNLPSSLGSGNNSAFLSLQTSADGGNANPVARIGVVGESYGSNNGAFVVATRDGGGVTERMRITSGGNVGIGTINLSSWDSGSRMIQFGSSGYASVGAILTDLHLNYNAYYSSTGWRAVGTASASNIGLWDGNINFRVSNGTVSANNAISWAMPMSIGNNGLITYEWNAQPPVKDGLYANQVLITNSTTNYQRIRFDVGSQPYWGLTREGDTNNFLISGFIAGSWTDNNFKIFQSTGNLALNGNGTDYGRRLQVFGNLGLGGLTYNWLISNVTDGNWGFGMFNSGSDFYPSVYMASDSSSHNSRGFRVRNVSTNTNIFVVQGQGNATFTGSVTAGGDVIAFSSSDKKLKDNIVAIENPLQKISKIGGYSFMWNSNQDTYSGKDYGVVAQEIEEIFPELVRNRDNGYKAVKYEKLIPLLIESIKELNKEVELLKLK